MLKYNQKDNVNLEIDSMVKEITTGVLGAKVKDITYDLHSTIDVDRLYVYDDGVMRLEYHEKGFNSKYDTYSKKYMIYYNGKLVYNSSKYKVEPTVVGRLREIYKEHLEKTKAKLEQYQEEQNKLEKRKIINKIFELTYPNGYEDSKIIVTNLNVKKQSYYSSEEGMRINNYIYNGIISLSNGMVIYDIANKIDHPGMWEDYVIDIVNNMIEERNQKRMEIQKEYEEKKQRIRRLKNEQYENNYTPVDDSKYFK